MFTYHLSNDNPLKFRKDNLSEIRKAILKLYYSITGVVPKPYQIVQDVKRVLVCLEEIVIAGGAVVPGLVNRNRHRAHFSIVLAFHLHAHLTWL
jgi:hypothetical protein